MNAHIQKLQKDLGATADGVLGPVTQAKLNYQASIGNVQIIKPVGVAKVAPVDAEAAPVLGAVPVWPRQDVASLTAFFGPAGGTACTAGRCKLPFSFPLAWNQDERITSFACHSKVEAHQTHIFAEAARHYGEKRFRELRLDQFGGCYNYRLKRTGTGLSTHAWGIADDIDPLKNLMKDGAVKATLDAPDYDAWWRIVESQGAISLGRTRNYDWMHFQFARL